MYKVILSDRAEKNLSRLDRAVQRRMIQAIDALARDPMKKSNVKKMTGSELSRLRVGDYRIIYSQEDQDSLIRVITLGHRKEVYR